LATLRALKGLARITGHNCQAALAFDIAEDATDMLQAFEEEASVLQALLRDADGRPFAQYVRPNVAGLAVPPEHVTDGHAFTGARLWVAHRIEREDYVLGTLYLQDDLSEVRRKLWQDMAVFTIVLCGALLVSFVLALRLRKPVADPILALADTARVVTEEHDYTVRADAHRGGTADPNDEIGVLTRTFNTMLERIQHRENALRQAHAALEEAHGELEARVEERTAELAASNRDLEEFAYVASHDLQEPLRMVTSYLQVLSRRYRGKLDDEADKFIDYAVDGAQRMHWLINDLLSYSRVAMRKREFREVSLNDVLDRVFLDLSHTIDETRAEVTRDPLPVVTGDPVQIGQLMQNLVGNAIKYRGEEPPRVHISAAEVPNEWVISVKDNGIGIEPQFLERIFVIFERLHSHGEYSGTGIGLSLCKRVVERHGGRIWAESEGTGKGTTVCVSLPKRHKEHGMHASNGKTRAQ